MVNGVEANKAGYDIYGLKVDNHDANGELVECPICKKNVAAARFAVHLEKCMGIGRTARTKRATVLKKTSSRGTAEGNQPSSVSDPDESKSQSQLSMAIDTASSVSSSRSSIIQQQQQSNISISCHLSISIMCRL